MKVADLQSLIKAAQAFAEAASISQAARNALEQAVHSLDLFRDKSMTEFAEFLKQSEEYHRTGILPVATKAKATTRNSGSAKSGGKTEEDVKLISDQLHSLHAKVHEESVGYGAIDEICTVISKFSAPQVRTIAENFGLKLGSKSTKPKSLEAINRKLTEQKGSAQRTVPVV